jgi:predicted Zn-dependent protease
VIRALVIVVAAAACTPRSDFLGAKLPAACGASARPHSASDEACVGWVFDRMSVLAIDDEYDDPRLTAYVTAIATRIATRNDLPVPTVRVVDRNAAPAYARPGGYVYVARDLLSVLASEAELAGVIAHEIAHDVAGHTADMLDAFPEITAGDGALLEARSRDDEATADELAVRYLAGAGYAPGAMRDALAALDRTTTEAWVREQLAEQSAEQIGPDAVDAVSGAAPIPDPEPIIDERRGFPRAIDSRDPLHPVMAERLARVTRLVAGRTAGERGVERYRDHIAGIVVGPDPRRGVLVGSTWSSARLGLAVDLPPGWETEGDETKVAAAAKTHEATVWAIGKDWGDAVTENLARARRTRVAGHPAVIGVVEDGPQPAKTSTLSLALDAPRPAPGSAIAVITVGRRALAIYVSGDDVERQLAFVLGRVRPLGADELAASVPARLAFHRAPFAGSVGALVKSLCARPVESGWLDDAAREVKAGDLVKCVEK